MTNSHNSKALMWTILLISFVQMPQFAILPGTNLISTEIFPELALQTVQTVMSLPGIVAVVVGVLSSLLIRYGWVSKKDMTIGGLTFLALTGVVALVFRTSIWQLCLMNFLIGAGIGTYVPSSQSIMFDSFDEDKRQFISGIQFSCINGGGLIMSLLCGLLITIVWYGGHLIMLVAVPIIIVAFIVIPKDKKMRSSPENVVVRSKLPSGVYFYTLMIVMFMIIYSVVTINISTHLDREALGGPSTAGVATALLMGGGVAAGFFFPKLSSVLRDQLIPVSFFVLAIGFALMRFFPSSLAITFVAMFLSGTTMSLLVPRCIFSVSNLTDPTNSATATMLVCCIAPGSGQFLSPLIMTNLTLALGGESTRFRFLFTAFVCLALALGLFLFNVWRERRERAVRG